MYERWVYLYNTAESNATTVTQEKIKYIEKEMLFKKQTANIAIYQNCVIFVSK